MKISFYLKLARKIADGINQRKSNLICYFLKNKTQWRIICKFYDKPFSHFFLQFFISVKIKIFIHSIMLKKIYFLIQSYTL